MRYIPTKKTAITIDYMALQRNFDRWARLSLEQALDEMADKAKDRAPVRNIFAGGQRPGEMVPRGIMKRNGKIFGRKVRHYSERSQKRFLEQVRWQTKPNREVRAPVFKGEEFVTTQRIRGNARSSVPVVRRADGTISTGQYRQAEISMGRARMALVEAGDVGSKTHRQTTGAEFMNARGRWELKRANEVLKKFREARKAQGRRSLQSRETASLFGGGFEDRGQKYAGQARMSKERFDQLKERGGRLQRPSTALFMAKTGELTVGGRLKEEIYAGTVEETTRGLAGDVVSPTYYAKYQEYGTSRHRAQPFMRPALYEMRRRFPEIVKQTVRSRK